MALHDTVRFSYRMPNGRNGCDYQTTDLECTLDAYEVTQLGRLVRVRTNSENERPLEDLNYSGWLDIFNPTDCYRLDFVKGTLRAIQIVDDEKWVLFEPSNYMNS